MSSDALTNGEARAVYVDLLMAVRRIESLSRRLTEAIGFEDDHLAGFLHLQQVDARRNLADVAKSLEGNAPQNDQETAILSAVSACAAQIAKDDSRYQSWRLSRFTGKQFAADWVEQALVNLPRLIDRPMAGALADSFKGVPAVVVSAGPSLDRNIRHLVPFRDQIVLIGMNQTVRALRRIGLEPDFVLALDGADLRYQFEDAGAKPLAASVVRVSVHPSVLEVPSTHLFSWSGNLPHERWVAQVLGGGSRSIMGGGGSVAHFCLSFARLIGCDPVILIGQDLAITGARYYASGAADHDHELSLSEDGQRIVHKTSERKARAIPRTANRTELLCEVEGYFGDVVQTTSVFSHFIDQFRELLEWFNGTPRVINATEGGARIPGTEQMGLREALERFCVGPVEVARVVESQLQSRDWESAASACCEELQLLIDTCTLTRRVASRWRTCAKKVCDQPQSVEDRERLIAETRRLVGAARPLTEVAAPALRDAFGAAAAAFAEAPGFTEAVQVFERLLSELERFISRVETAAEQSLTAISERATHAAPMAP